jgi:hypothetical protein
LLDVDQTNRWAEWTALVHANYSSKLDIAVRRTLSAATERADPTDGLIDAVIAWENLFGSGSGESTLRVSASVAWLLGTNAPERAAIRDQVKKIYDLRSKVVHGSRALGSKEATDRRSEAVDLTLRTLRTIFRDRRDLLTCKDSSARSAKVIIDS